MIENLKQIQSSPDYYIDIKGNVYDSDLKVLKPFISARGVYVVTLRRTLSKRKNRGDNRRLVIIGRLLLEHFIRKPNSEDIVSFIDGNTLNNELSNLRWVSRNDVHVTKFDDKTILDIKQKLLEGISITNITKEFGISYTHVSRIKRGITRTYLNTN